MIADLSVGGFSPGDREADGNPRRSRLNFKLFKRSAEIGDRVTTKPPDFAERLDITDSGSHHFVRIKYSPQRGVITQ